MHTEPLGSKTASFCLPSFASGLSKGKDKDANPKPFPETYQAVQALPSAELGNAVGEVLEGILCIVGSIVVSGRFKRKPSAEPWVSQGWDCEALRTVGIQLSLMVGGIIYLLHTLIPQACGYANLLGGRNFLYLIQ